MKYLIINSHPVKNNLSGNILARLHQRLTHINDEVEIHHLYEEEFPPLLKKQDIDRGLTVDPLVRLHQKELEECDRLVLFYPDWWGMPPAILKGWIDRIMAPELAYRWAGDEFEEKYWEPLLAPGEAHILVSADNMLNKPFIESLWKGVLGKCGMKTNLELLDNLKHRNYGEIEHQVNHFLAQF